MTLEGGRFKKNCKKVTIILESQGRHILIEDIGGGVASTAS